MKTLKWNFYTALGLLGLGDSSPLAAEDVTRPVTPGASPEAVALLRFFHGISGKRILSGQHNFPAHGERHTTAAARAWGKVPTIFGKDWGFAREGDQDSAYVRDQIVEELIEQYRKGDIASLCWHKVPPTADEPVNFRRRRGCETPGAVTNLNTVRGQLTEAQYQDLLTPGTGLQECWYAQVDALVPHFKKLEAARVPLLWRPFHQMNGNWSWWGGRRSEYGTAALYKMMFDRLVKHHQIKNLIWVWSVDRPEGTSLKFEECWPGPEYVDIFSLDCYREFKQSYYDDLLKLANGKPIALAEVGTRPSPAVLEAQLNWTWWMSWAGMGGRSDAATRGAGLVAQPYFWSLSDPGYRKAIVPVRRASGFPAELPESAAL